LNLDLDAFQSNHEGAIVDAIQEARHSAAGIIINAGAFSHYSWAIHDALDVFGGPVVELHLSNPGAREEFRHHSVITHVATGVISGFRGHGYELAVRAIAQLISEELISP
jgi:3-dehydroquinate dehydratase-2